MLSRMVAKTNNTVFQIKILVFYGKIGMSFMKSDSILQKPEYLLYINKLKPTSRHIHLCIHIFVLHILVCDVIYLILLLLLLLLLD